jgi:hypothetical protein
MQTAEPEIGKDLAKIEPVIVRVRPAPETENPPRMVASWFSSETIHFEQNTTLDRTSQSRFEFVFHRGRAKAGYGFAYNLPYGLSSHILNGG